MNESQVDKEQVRREHLAAIDQRAHWAFLITVLGGGFVVMLLLMAALAGSGG
jgi:hypothetical protein